MYFVEAIINPSSQVITMLEKTCNMLGLIYNPNVHLHMQSANGKVDKMLGLAWNMLMLIGETMLYVQVHVVCQLAYNILLSHPFDILTQSIVWNYSSKDQSITIHDPNSGHTTTISTFPGGSHPHAAQPPPGF